MWALNTVTNKRKKQAGRRAQNGEALKSDYMSPQRVLCMTRSAVRIRTVQHGMFRRALA